MKSILYPGDIIMVRNVKFKDTNKVDINLNGHPMLVLNNVNNIGDTIYCLHLSSTFRTSLSHYYPIKLSKESYIDLKFVYKLECKTLMEVKNTIREETFNDILDKMTKLHESGTIRSKREYIEFYDKYISKEKRRYNSERLIRQIGASCDKTRECYKQYLSSKNDKIKLDLYNEINLICENATKLAQKVIEDEKMPREKAFEMLAEKGYITKRSCKTLIKITDFLDKFVISSETKGIANELTEKELDDYVLNKINVIWQYALLIKENL